MKVVKRYKLPVLGLISTRAVMYNMINTVNTAVSYIWKLLRESILRVLITRKKIF